MGKKQALIMVISLEESTITIEGIGKNGDLCLPITLKLPVLDPTLFAIDAIEITFVLRTAIHQFIKKISFSFSICQILLFSNNQGVLAWNPQTGQPLSSVIYPHHKSHKHFFRQLEKNKLNEHVHAHTGLFLTQNSALLAFQALLKESSLQQSLASKNAVVGPLISWLLYELTGKVTFKLDPTLAQKTQLFDIHAKKWDTTICEYLNLSEHSLPSLHHSDQVIGKTSGFIPLEDHIPILSTLSHESSLFYSCRSFDLSDCYLFFSPSRCDAFLYLGSFVDPIIKENYDILLLPNQHYMLKFPICLPSWPEHVFGSLPRHPFSKTSSERSIYFFPNALLSGLTGTSKLSDVHQSFFDSSAFSIKHCIDHIQKNTSLSIKQIYANGYLCEQAYFPQSLADILQQSILSYPQPLSSVVGGAFFSHQHSSFFKTSFHKSFIPTHSLPQLDPISSLSLYNQWFEHYRHWASS